MRGEQPITKNPPKVHWGRGRRTACGRKVHLDRMLFATWPGAITCASCRQAMARHPPMCEREET